MAKNKRPIQVDSDEDEIQEATQFSAHSSDSASNFWDVKRVLKEWNGKYLVEWAGVDEYGKPYPQSWIPKEDCTDALIEDWKATKPQKKGKQRAKSNETSSSRQRSTNSSRGSEATQSNKASREQSLGNIGEIVRSPSHMMARPYVDIVRKRQRSPEPRRSSPIGLASETKVIDQGSIDNHKNKKRRRMADSPEIEFQDLPTPENISIKKSNPPAQSKSSRRPPESPTSGPDKTSPKSSTKVPAAPPVLHPVPQPSPSVFRNRLGSALSSQIEQFTTPESSQRTSKDKISTSTLNLSPLKDQTRERESLQSRLNRATKHAPERMKELERIQHGEGLIGKEQVIAESTRSPTKLSPRSVGDAAHLDDSIVPSSLPEDAYEYDEPVNLDNIIQQSPPSPVTRPRSPGLSPKSPFRRSPSKRQSDEVELKLVAKDAMIVALEARITMMQEDRDRMEQRLETNTRDHALTKRNMEQQITSLTTALKQFSSVIDPASVDAILKQDVGSTSAADVPMVQNPTPQTYVRSADDDQLIRGLREENAKLQDTVVQLRAERTSSDAMLEQVRDVARRAEAAKFDLNRQVRTLTETAKNAPKIAEEMYQSQLTAAEEETEKLKTQLEILLEQNRRTGDIIRKKAAKSDAFSSKYRSLTEKYERLFLELSEVEEERDGVMAELEVAKAMIERLGGTAPTRDELQHLIFGMKNEGSESSASSLPMFFRDDARNGHEAATDDNEESVSGSASAPPENAGPTLVIEGAVSSVEPVFDPPNLVMEEELVVDEETQLQADDTAASENLKDNVPENSEEFVWLCFWHPTEDACTERFTSKEDLRAHVFGAHVNL